MSIREQFKQTEKLYHFTSFDTALKIIESNRLRFGRLSNMNDIHENDKLMFADANGLEIDEFPSDVLDALYDEIYKYRQISLTADSEDGDKDGFDLHQMWGLYADKGEGVCLVFDKDELEKNYDMINIHKKRVNYDKTQELDSYIVSLSQKPGNVPAEVKSQLSKIFFHKRKEWEHEQEYRLIKRCPNTVKEEYLLLGHALKFVILSSKLRNIDEVRYFKKIKDIKEKLRKVEEARHVGDVGNIPVLVYGNGLFDYALVTSNHDNIIWDSKNGYNLIDIAEMSTKYTREQLLRFSSEDILEKTNGKAVDFHFNNGRWIQLCANDLQSFDSENSCFHTRTDIKIQLQDVDYIEIFG